MSDPVPPADSPAETARRGCTPECWTEETCATCHRIKAPTGRDLPMAAAGGYCDRDCSGYGWPRRHLWDEHDSARYPVVPYGPVTVERLADAA